MWFKEKSIEDTGLTKESAKAKIKKIELEIAQLKKIKPNPNKKYDIEEINRIHEIDMKIDSLKNCISIYKGRLKELTNN